MKACKDCHFYDQSWGDSCNRPELRRFDLVDGELPSYPLQNREAEDRCGPGAKFFETRSRPGNWWRAFCSLA